MADLSGVWRYDTSEVLAAPAAGYMRSGPAPVSWLALSTQTWGGADVQADLLGLGSNDQISIQEVADATLASKFQVTAAAVDHSTWVEYAAVPVATTATGPPRKNEDLLVLGFLTPGAAHSYATVDQLNALLRLDAPTSIQLDAMQRCLDAAAAEIDWYLDYLTPPPEPYPALVVEVNLERAVEHWKQGQAPFAIIGQGGDTVPIIAARDSWYRHGLKLNSLKHSWGVA